MLDSPSEELSTLRKEYRKQYQKQYQKKYAQERICRAVVFSNEEYTLLKQASENHKLPFSSFVRESSLSYLSNCYIVPNKEQTKALLIALKRYGVNLNQIAYRCNTQKSVSSANVFGIQNNFNSLSEKIMQIFTAPIQIEDLIHEVIREKPEYTMKIQRVLNEFETSKSI